MTNAFQSLGFQHPGFQGTGGVTPTPTPDVVGGRGKRHRRHKITVEIDGEEFEVSSIEQGRELLMRAREAAKEAAARAAEAAARKAMRKAKPAAVDRALAIHVPRILVYGDGSELLLQQMRASVDAAQAAVEAIYAEAIVRARARYLELLADDEEVLAHILLNE